MADNDVTPMSIEIETADRSPRRTLDKQEAVHHLIHTAIRMIMKMEDPFAIHLLVHSADKMLLDLAKRHTKELRVDWELFIKKEYHDQFFSRHRATYNYFKHADKDFADDLPVHDIVMLNIMTVFHCVANYVELFAQKTDHMLLFQIFVMNLMPDAIILPEPVKSELLSNIASTKTMTPQRFFEAFEQNAHVLPRFCSEISADIQDVVDFYHLSFEELRRGDTKSHRLMRLPD